MNQSLYSLCPRRPRARGRFRSPALLVQVLALVVCLAGCPLTKAQAKSASRADAPVIVGLSAEYGVQGSQVALAIERGIRQAMDEINRAGGVLGGRPLKLETRDDRGVPMRGTDNLREFSANPNVVAVMGGRFSPVALEQAPLANQLGIPLLGPWAAAEGVTQVHGDRNYVFRLSLTDSWALQALLAHARERGYKRLVALFPNTAWGRSSEAAMLKDLARRPGISQTSYWYNWGDLDFSRQLLEGLAQRPDAILMVANESEGAHIVGQLAALRGGKGFPVLAHWGITGGNFPTKVGLGPDLGNIQLVVPQSFTFEDLAERPVRPRLASVARGYRALYGEDPRDLRAQVGFAHAYDLTHLLARAIARAGSTDRTKIRNALEKTGHYSGLVRDYRRPFSPSDHEALDAGAAFIATYNSAGRLQRVRQR